MINLHDHGVSEDPRVGLCPGLLNQSFREITCQWTFHASGRKLASKITMKVTIQLLGQARQLAKSDRVTMEVPEGASVDDLVPGLLGEASERLLTVLVEDQRLRRSVMAILRDETIDPAAPNLLQDGDELSLLPPMSGG
ncbi:MAG: hypothetical protein CMN05_08940 [Roseibacillus sp.]|nr:hypothetical protein [Roseibacillus sp.]MBP35773.1 hypothetical protein [Roseibacillus sp.]